MKAKSSKQIERFDAIMRKLSKAEQRTIAQFGRDKIEQGKKEAEKKCPYATGIPPYFKKAKEKCIVVIGERDIIRKQTLEEVLKEVKDNVRYYMGGDVILMLERKLRETK